MEGRNMKHITFFITIIVSFIVCGNVFAGTEVVEAVNTGLDLAPIGAGLIMAMAAGLGTLAQSKAAAAALEGITRNPESKDKVQTPMIIALAFMESLVIFAFITALSL